MIWNASRRLIAAVLTAGAVLAGPALAQDVPANDNLNATLWMQRSVEFKGTALAAFALARFRLDQALADKSWTGAPAEQKGDYQNLPPAVIIDIDETLMDNSHYQAWMTINGQNFSSKTWGQFVEAQMSVPVAGAVEFAKHAESKGVKVFYISNRTAKEEAATRKNMEKFGFPMGGNVDTFLTAQERPEWGSAKSTRRAHVAKDYRVLLNIGDNFGDFVDAYKGTEAERLKVFDENAARWGREWIVLANPTYGSFESAPYNHNFKLGDAEKRKAKRDVLQAWPGP